jgi:hypothetical protein
MTDLDHAIAIIEARLPLYTDIGQINALRECVSSIRSAALAHPGQVREIASVLPIEPPNEVLVAMWNAMFEEKFDGTQAPMMGAGYDALRSALALPLPVQESVPEGWKLVPIEPTETMINEADAAGARSWYTGERMAAAILKAGIAAALSPSPSIPEEKGGTAESVVGWQPIETAPKDRQFLAYGSYLYPGDRAVTDYTMIAEFSCGDAEWPYRTHEGTHRKGFFSHWMPLPPSPTEGQTVKEGSTDA